MLDMILIALAVVAAGAVLYALARRSAPAADSVAGPPEAAADREPAGGSREFAPLPDPDAWQWATVSDLSVAEDLLDQAEAEGYPERELLALGNSLFLVRWRGRRAAPGEGGEESE
jgi:hypothetical protein